MQKILMVGLIIFSLTFSGCIPLIIGGAVGVGVHELTKRRPKLTEMQRRNLECKEIEGSREDTLRAVVTAFQDKSYSVQSSDYDGGIIIASSIKPFFHITVSVEEFTSERTKIRITMKDRDGPIEDVKKFAELFDSIQAEVFRRTNLNK